MDSEAIADLSYDDETSILFVRFTSGELYAYQRVERETYDDFRVAPSPGHFFHERILNRYPYARIDDDTDLRAVVFRWPKVSPVGPASPPPAGAGR